MNIFSNLDQEHSYQKKKYYPKSELIAYLIGNEIKSYINNTKATKVIIIGSNYNSKLYSKAMQVLKIKNTRVVEFIFLTSFFFIIPIEEFNALTGLILGYAYTILIRKQIIE